MSSKQLREPLVADSWFEGGDDGEDGEVEDAPNTDLTLKSLWCTCTEADEGCGPSCTYQKFPKDHANLTRAQKKHRFKDRVGFIRKTYGILLCQLLYTAVFVGAAISVKSLEELVIKIWVIASIVAVVAILTLLFASANADDKNKQGIPMHMATPYNYILLSLFTICVSVMVAKIALATDKQIVFEAFVLTTAAVIGITIFALTGFRKIEGVKQFSIMAPALSAIGMIFAVTGLFVFLPVTNLVSEKVPEGEEKALNFKVLYAFIAIVLFALIMLFDTSQIVGGKSTMFEMGPECYILGALQLYLEYISMFVLIMVVLGEAN